MSSFVTINSNDTKVKVNAIPKSRTLTFSGAGVSVIDDPVADTVDVVITGSGVGEANDAANVGTGEGTVFRDKSIVTLNFKTLKAGSNITITNNANDITIAGPAASGEANTTSSSSIGGVDIVLPKSGVNLPFKGIAAGSAKIVVSDDATNKNVLIDSALATTSQAGVVTLATSGQSTAGVVVQGNDARMSDARSPTVHKATHTAASSDTFVKSDILSAVSRYLELTTDPSSDTGRIWVNAANLKYWDNTAVTPVLQTIERLSNKGVASGYADLDASAFVPLSRLSGITNTQISGSAAIAYSKLNLATSILNADINASAGIVYSKLSLGNSIVNADINTAAAIAYSKLSLTTSIVNGDIATAAAIAFSKLGTNLKFSETGLTAPRTFTLPDSNGTIVIGTDTRLSDARTPTSHKATHISTGTDSFVKGDILIAASRYIDTSTDPTSDVGRIWINAANLKYWDNTAVTPVLQTIERLSNKAVASGYCDLDSSTLVPLARISGLTNTQISGSAAIAYGKLSLASSIVNADIAAGAAIAYSKLSLAASIVNADISTSAAIAYTKLNLASSITDTDIAVAAAIAYSKLSLSNSIINSDISTSAAIAYSKLSLSNSIVNADVNSSAAIAYSKLNLAGSIVNADIATAAGIAKSKLAALSISDADTVTFTTTKISVLSKSLLNSSIAYTDQANVFGAFDQTIPSGNLKLSNSGFTSIFTVGTLGGNTTLTFPSITDTLVGRTTTDTLTNKTLTTPTIASILNSGTLTLPTSTDTLVGRATTDTLTNKTLTSPIISSISNTGTVTLPTANDTLVARTTTDTLTNKTISGASNTITNIGKSAIPATTVYTDQTNTFGAFDQVISSTRLKLENSTFKSTFTVGTLGADTTLTFPSVTETIVARGTTDTLTNKTVNATNNTITDTSTASGDILKSNGTKFTKFGVGSPGQVLAVNAGGTDLEWITPVGGGGGTEVKGFSTQSGDAVTTVFTITHGLGTTPSWVSVIGTSVDSDSDFSFTYTTTTITITYSFPPPSGTNNLVWDYRVI